MCWPTQSHEWALNIDDAFNTQQQDLFLSPSIYRRLAAAHLAQNKPGSKTCTKCALNKIFKILHLKAYVHLSLMTLGSGFVLLWKYPGTKLFPHADILGFESNLLNQVPWMLHINCTTYCSTMSRMYLSAGCIMAQLRVSSSEGSAETPKGLRVAVLSRSHFSQYDLDFEYLQQVQ